MYSWVSKKNRIVGSGNRYWIESPWWVWFTPLVHTIVQISKPIKGFSSLFLALANQVFLTRVANSLPYCKKYIYIMQANDIILCSLTCHMFKEQGSYGLHAGSALVAGGCALQRQPQQAEGDGVRPGPRLLVQEAHAGIHAPAVLQLHTQHVSLATKRHTKVTRQANICYLQLLWCACSHHQVAVVTTITHGGIDCHLLLSNGFILLDVFH